MPTPKRGEIWSVRFEPQVGREIMKLRPAVIVSASTLEYLPLRIVVPIRDLKEIHLIHSTYVPIQPTKENGLVKASMIDVAQVHAFDLKRFRKRIGVIEPGHLERVVLALSQAIGL